MAECFVQNISALSEHFLRPRLFLTHDEQHEIFVFRSIINSAALV